MCVSAVCQRTHQLTFVANAIVQSLCVEKKEKLSSSTCFYEERKRVRDTMLYKCSGIGFALIGLNTFVRMLQHHTVDGLMYTFVALCPLVTGITTNNSVLFFSLCSPHHSLSLVLFLYFFWMHRSLCDVPYDLKKNFWCFLIASPYILFVRKREQKKIEQEIIISSIL